MNEIRILTVVNDRTAKKPAELYNFFINNGYFRLQFIPCVERNAETGEAMDYSVTVEDYRDFLCILFDVWYNRGQPVASIRLYGAAFQVIERELLETIFFIRKR